MRTRLDRLIKDGKVVGYQKQEGGKIYLQFYGLDSWLMVGDKGIAGEVVIEWDRIDQYTGVDVDGVEVFERDSGIIGGEAFTVRFINGSWAMITERPRVDFIQDLYRNIKHARITGIN